MNNPRRIAIVLHGDRPVNDDIQLWTKESDLVVAADGAADLLMNIGIAPDVVIGDMDGVSADTLQERGDGTVIFEEGQNNTDFQKALKYAESLSPDSIAILNFEGHRLDHVLSALFTDFDKNLRFIGSDAQVRKLPQGRHSIRTKPECRISLLALEPSEISNAEGLQYDPVGLKFEIGGRDGVSNRATGDHVRLTVALGSFLVFVQRFAEEERW